MRLTDLLWVVKDWVIPRARPLSKKESGEQRAQHTKEMAEGQKRIAALPDEENILTAYLGECTKLLEAEEARRQSVETRLTSIMGLSSIAATLVFGSILAQATGALHVQEVWLRWVLALGALYLAIQLCSAIIAALHGLERRAYLSTTTLDFLPLPNGEARSACLRRRIGSCLSLLADHRSLNNEKVTQMAVAHCALRNFLWFLVALALLGTYGAVKSSSHGDDLIEKLRQNHKLQELLRGPQGPPGPKGDPCGSQPQAISARHHGKRP